MASSRAEREAAEGIVALFNASDDTITMIQTILKKGDRPDSGVVSFCRPQEAHC